MGSHLGSNLGFRHHVMKKFRGNKNHLLPKKSAKDAVLHCAHEHPNEKVEPGESLQSPGRAPVNRHYAGTHRGYARGQPGLHRESIQMFNTSGMNQELPGRTGNNRLGTGNNRDCTGNNRDGTVRAPVYLCNVTIKGLCRHSPGLHRGVAVPSRLFPVPRRSLPVLPGDSRFIPERNTLLANR
ncbi:hypothetical protein DPMN_046302 [Dreissena polymorpha]|uniref:Uncharacterized protein n=1 Tax=Dreissena polymorpha TaxID=45954 RepID=A0A9D4D5Y7_DREPO|nr:hypothetical protein DPMN_046302 [Dreissena polymorpha]